MRTKNMMPCSILRKLFFAAVLVGLALCPAETTRANIIFSDNFNSGASPAWGNENGSWTASGGVYSAQFPSTNPPAYSSVTTLPGLTDFIVDVDVNSLDDGGIFLRSSDINNGVVLITGGFSGSFNGLYWHIRQGGSWGSVLNQVGVSGLQGSDAHLRIEVSGNDYRAFLNGSTTPVTTLNTSAFSSGKAALYDFSNQQTFDNFEISVSAVPEPASLLLLGTGILGILNRQRRRRRHKLIPL